MATRKTRTRDHWVVEAWVDGAEAPSRTWTNFDTRAQAERFAESQRSSMGHRYTFRVRDAHVRSNPSRSRLARMRKNPSRSSGDTPQVYAVNLASYNAGRTKGGWVDLTGVQDAEDVWAALREVVGNAEEVAIHDYKQMPSLGEYPSMSDVALVAQAVEEHGLEIVKCAIDTFPHSVEYALEVLANGYGEYDSEEDFGHSLVDDMGIENLGGNADYYFDYDAYGRDIRLSGDVDDDEIDGKSDQEIGEHFVDEFGGVSELSKKTREMYFDYESFGRDALMDYAYGDCGGKIVVFWEA